MATLRSRGEEKRAFLSPISANANWFMNFRYIGMERKGYYPNHQPSSINRSSAALCQAKNKTFLLGKMVRILRKRPFHRKIVNYNAPHKDSLLARHSSRPAQHLASPRSLTLLSLRCGIVNCQLWIECHARSKSITCMHEIGDMHVPSAFHARNLWRRFI